MQNKIIWSVLISVTVLNVYLIYKYMHNESNEKKFKVESATLEKHYKEQEKKSIKKFEEEFKKEHNIESIDTPIKTESQKEQAKNDVAEIIQNSLKNNSKTNDLIIRLKLQFSTPFTDGLRGLKN